MKKVAQKSFVISYLMFIASYAAAQPASDAASDPSNNQNPAGVTLDPQPAPTGIRAILLENPDDFWISRKENVNIFTFDSRSMAMEVKQGNWSAKLSEPDKTEIGAVTFTHDLISLFFGDWDGYWEEKYLKQHMYFDQQGYIYTQDKRRWVKTPFAFMKSMMKGMFGLTNGLFPSLQLPDGKVTYYGIDVSPDHYPILEWAFRYKVDYFEKIDELGKEFVECGGEGGCMKYTVTSGKDKGSYVLFDNWGRLAEIRSINSGSIVYVYGDYRVKLPEARTVGSF